MEATPDIIIGLLAAFSTLAILIWAGDKLHEKRRK